MLEIFSDENRRNPYPLYEQVRATTPVLRVPPPFNAWLMFDYASVKRALSNHAEFSSAVPAPPHWFIFYDPPAHTKLRGLISQAFTPKMIANLEPSIRDLSRHLLDQVIDRGEMDLVAEYAAPLPMKVIAGMIGIPPEDWSRFLRWSDGILKISYARSGGAEAEQAMKEFRAVTSEMNSYLLEMIQQRRSAPKDDLLTRLIQAEVDGEQLRHEEILGFFQLLIVGGQETTTNLIDNAIICLLENPEQLARLRTDPHLIPAAIEEVLRYRSPVQWVMRTPRQELEVQGSKILPGELVLAVIGSANRDPKALPKPDTFDLSREPNPHVGFGHGIHSCLGAALARMEARIALGDLLQRFAGFELGSKEPWRPRQALHVHGPTNLLLRFEPRKP